MRTGPSDDDDDQDLLFGLFYGLVNVILIIGTVAVGVLCIAYVLTL